MPSTFAGVPLHPLIVHAVVVLVPLACLLVLLSIVVPRFRHWAGPMPAIVATVALLAVPLATSSGENLEERVAETALMEKHAEMGEQLLPWMAALAVLAWVLWLVGRRSRGSAGGSGRRGGLVMVVSAFALVALVGSSVQVYRIGHSGAASVWDGTDVPAKTQQGDGD